MYHIVIPARYGSTRLRGKMLADVNGHPMVWWAWRRACQANAMSVVVATDHEEIAEIMMASGATVVMTCEGHPSGTDRLADVADQQGWSDNTIAVNLQGDEPLMPVANIDQVAHDLADHPEASITTLSEVITSVTDFENPDIVKVVTSAADNALYFSRATIPFSRNPENDPEQCQLLKTIRRHVGLYAYRCGFLREFVRWNPAPIEQLESLEQLRALHNDRIIRVLPAQESVPAGVDTPKDLKSIRKLMGNIQYAD